MTRSIWKGPFVDGYLLEEGRRRARFGPLRHHQDLEPPLDHPAAVRRPHLRRLQRPQAHSGARVGGDDRPQVRRVRADAHVPRPFRRQEGEEGVSHVQASQSAAPRRQRGQGDRPHAAREPAEAQPSRPAHPRQEGRDRARRSRVLAQADLGRGEEGARIARSPTPRTTTISTSTISSSRRPGSARTW